MVINYSVSEVYKLKEDRERGNGVVCVELVIAFDMFDEMPR